MAFETANTERVIAIKQRAAEMAEMEKIKQETQSEQHDAEL